jgi:O-antigen biosynthesis protein
VHGLASLLAEEDLVDIGLEDAPLVVAVFDEQGDQRLVELAHETLAAIEEQVLDQLLGQRRATLDDATGSQVGPARAQDGGQVDAVVVLEIAILHCLQARDEQGRQLFELDEAALFLLRAIQRGDARGVDFGKVQGLAVGTVDEAGNASAGEFERDALGCMSAIEADEGATADDEAVAIARIGSGCLRRRRRAIAGGFQFQLQGLGIHRPPRRQIERPREHAARDLPAQVVEALAHLVIERDRVGDEEPDQGADTEQDWRTQQAPKQGDEGKQTSEQGEPQIDEVRASVARKKARARVAAVTVRVGIADNRSPLVLRTTVQKLPSDSVCLCVHGPGTCSELWLEGLIAQAPVDAQLVLLGAATALPGRADALRMPDLAAEDSDTLATALATRLPGRNLLIVRSDAELPKLVLPRLLHALDLTGVLAAGALDNLNPARSPLPGDCSSDASVERIDALCFAYSRRRLIDASELTPLASAWHGQHLLKRRPGLRTVLLDHCYVAASGQALAGAPESADPLDPLPPSPLAELRQHIAEALASAVVPGRPALTARPVILHVLHGWGGGAERWVRDFCSAFAGADHLILKSSGSHQRRQHGEWLDLHDGSLAGPPLRRLALPCAIADTAVSDPGYRELLGELLAEHAVDAIIVSSLIGHSLDVLRSGLPTVRIVHDHYPLWPVLHRNFSDADLRFDDAQREADLAALGRDREFANADAAHWKALRDSTTASLLEARVLLVAPSQSALRNDLRLAPELAPLPHAIIPHGLSVWPGHAPRAVTPPVRPKLRLVFPGRVRRGKGAELLEQVLPRLVAVAEVFLLGAGTDAHAFFGMDGVHILLDYRREDLPGLLADLAADAAVLLPTVAETFGYTLSELRDLGMPVIATRLGAYAERIEDGVDGFLVDTDADAVVARIIELSSQRQILRAMRDRLGTRREPDLAVMAEAYANVLALPSVSAVRYPVASIDAASQLLAARCNQLAHSRRQVDALELQLHQLQTEIARRGDWGHALDRQLASSRTQVEGLESELETRTAWAQRLDTEVEALRPFQPAYQTVIASRSWRLTAPLRNTATRLRHLRAALAFRKHRLIAQLRRFRGSLVQHGLAGTWARILRELGGSRPIQLREIIAEPSDEFSPFALPTSAQPRVSIIIPVHNKFAYTAACLRSRA